jgi:GT2 family glycosyltransferase
MPANADTPRDLSTSVVIPVRDGGEAFRRCLQGVAALAPAPLEVIVVVDGDDPASAAAVAADLAAARCLRLPSRRGPAAARNAGARAARGDLLLFLDADVVPAPGLVGQVQAAFRADPGLAALIGSYDDRPAAPSFLSQYRNLLHHHTHQTGARRASTFWGACGAVRRSVLEALGGFDEDYAIPAVEDIELGYRMRRAGHRIELRREIQVTHLKHWGLRNMLVTDIRQRAIPWTRLLLREGTIRNDLNLRTEGRLSAVLAWLLLLALCCLPWWSAALWPAAVAALLLLGLNAPFYRFLARARGPGFALAAIPWHWLYFLYASAAFAYVMLGAQLGAARQSA